MLLLVSRATPRPALMRSERPHAAAGLTHPCAELLRWGKDLCRYAHYGGCWPPARAVLRHQPRPAGGLPDAARLN
jgi:hypothetical protein